MIPTEHTAKSASMPKTGRFATLRGLLHAQGSGAPTRSMIAIPLVGLCACVGLLMLSTAVARAEAPKLISDGSFSSVATNPVGVAVDQPSGDVYVAAWYDETQPPINEFDGSGKLISPPSPFGEGLHSGAAVDPVNGDLDLLNAFGAIETYDPSTGALLSSFEVPGSLNFFGVATMVQIATDSAGDVYVPVVPKNEVLEYSPAGTLLKTFTGSGALKEPAGVAVAPSGDLWVADAGNKRIEELSPSDAPIAEIASEGVESVTLDGHGDVLAIVRNKVDFCNAIPAPCTHLVEYSSSGVQLADVGAGSLGGAEEAEDQGDNLRSMVAVDEASGRVYVSDPYKERVLVFVPPTAPVIGKEFTAEVNTSKATLGALVNPGGAPTSFRFEYGTTDAYGQTAPLPEGSVGENLTLHTVWAGLSGLSPGTTYHYRVVATSELGTVVGPDQTFTTETAAQASCPNEQLRGGFSAKLPDCRAYELVTPLVKTSVVIRQVEAVARGGDAIAFETNEPLPGASSGGFYYVDRRGSDGWTSEDLMPLESYSGLLCTSFSSRVVAYSSELSRDLISFGHDDRSSERGGASLNSQECNAEGVEAVSGEPVGYQNLLSRDNETGSLQLVNAMEPGLTSVPADAFFVGASADLSHVAFSEGTPLTANAPAGAVEDLYEWDEGVVRLLTVLPDGSPVAGTFAGFSADGTDAFFTADGELFARLNGERTVQIDESRGGTGPGGGGALKGVSADGSQVFFTDDASAGLTSDTVAGSGSNLYRYDLDTGQLSDLTPVGEAKAVFTGSGEDGAYVYFEADGVLSGSQANQLGETAEAGQPNFYLDHNGAITFISHETGGGQLSPNGTYLAFTSDRSLTGYDNAGQPEIYLYSAASNSFACASCNPSGEPGDGVIGGTVTDSGQVFFVTPYALVPSDTNGQPDVYEYEDGEPLLISPGTGPGSALVGVSESGDDVFFDTAQQLVPQDTVPEMGVIYAARVDGGFPAVAPPPPCTTADACRAAVSSQPLIYGAPPSQTFSGVGNLTASAPTPVVKPKSKPVKCKRRSVAKKDRCVKRPNKKAGKKAKPSVHSSKAGK